MSGPISRTIPSMRADRLALVVLGGALAFACGSESSDIGQTHATGGAAGSVTAESGVGGNAGDPGDASAAGDVMEATTADATNADASDATNADASDATDATNADASDATIVPCQDLCVDPNAHFSTAAGCKCDPIYIDTDPGTCSATCVPKPIKSVRVETFIDHSAVGDLVIKLVAPGGIVVTVLNRPGFAESADDGEDGLGSVAGTSSKNLTFGDSAGAIDAELLGVGMPAGSQVCTALYCEYKASSGAAGGPTLSTFAGGSAMGTWAVCVGDSNPGATGVLQAFTVNFTFQGSATLKIDNVNLPIPDDDYDGTLASMVCGSVDF